MYYVGTSYYVGFITVLLRGPDRCIDQKLARSIFSLCNNSLNAAECNLGRVAVCCATDCALSGVNKWTDERTRALHYDFETGFSRTLLGQIIRGKKGQVSETSLTTLAALGMMALWRQQG